MLLFELAISLVVIVFGIRGSELINGQDNSRIRKGYCNLIALPLMMTLQGASLVYCWAKAGYTVIDGIVYIPGGSIFIGGGIYFTVKCIWLIAKKTY